MSSRTTETHILLQTCCTLTFHIYKMMKPFKLILTDLITYKSVLHRLEKDL